MQELEVNKVFNTRQEMEEYERQLTEKYVVICIFHKDQEIGQPEIYGIDTVMHCGERR